MSEVKIYINDKEHASTGCVSNVSSTTSGIGQMYLSGEAPEQNFAEIDTYEVVRAWNYTGVSGLSSPGILPSPETNSFTLNPGIYFVLFNTSISGRINSVVDAGIFINNIEAPQCHWQRTFSSNTEIGVGFSQGAIRITDENSVVDLRAKADGDNDFIVLSSASFTILKISG